MIYVDKKNKLKEKKKKKVIQSLDNKGKLNIFSSSYDDDD
jgi:hypothetical protein